MKSKSSSRSAPKLGAHDNRPYGGSGIGCGQPLQWLIGITERREVEVEMCLEHLAMIRSLDKRASECRLDLVATTHVYRLQGLGRVHRLNHRHRDPCLAQVVDQFQQLWDHVRQCTLPASEPISTQVIDRRMREFPTSGGAARASRASGFGPRPNQPGKRCGSLRWRNVPGYRRFGSMIV